MSIKERKGLDEIMREINDEFGESTLMRLDKAPKVNVDTISTGSYSLDRALGVGGLPRGRIVEIYGPESSGKTTLALNVIAQVQKTGGKAAFIDAEHALDPEYAQRIGVQLNGLVINQPDSGEAALNLALKLITSGTVDVIVIDSVAALTPKAELEGDVGKQQMGLQARMMGQALRKMQAVASKANVLIIFINQIRMKLGGLPFMNPETTPGGVALKFACSVRIEIRRTDKIKDKDDIIVGNNVKAKVVKNKVSVPFKVADFSIVYGEGIDFTLDVLNTAIKDGVVKKDGNSYMFGEERLGVGLTRTCQTLKEQPELFTKILDSMSPKIIEEKGETSETTDDHEKVEPEKILSPQERRKLRREKRTSEK